MTQQSVDPDDQLRELLELAQKHGEEGEFEDGATHEVGDLQELCTAMWERLTDEQRRSFLESEAVLELRKRASDKEWGDHE